MDESSVTSLTFEHSLHSLRVLTRPLTVDSVVPAAEGGAGWAAPAEVVGAHFGFASKIAPKVPVTTLHPSLPPP